MIKQGSEVVTSKLYGSKRGFVGFIFNDGSFRLYRNQKDAMNDRYQMSFPDRHIGTGRVESSCDVTPLPPSEPGTVRLRCIDPASDLTKGKIYNGVAKPHFSSFAPGWEVVDDFGGKYWYLKHRFEVVKDEPKTSPIKVGDWVYVKNGQANGRRGDFFGYVGAIVGKYMDLYGNPNKMGFVGMSDSQSTVMLVSDKPTEMVWWDKNGKAWFPHEMSDEHLTNALDYVRIRLDDCDAVTDPGKQEAARQHKAFLTGWREVFRKELATREAAKPKPVEKRYNVWINAKVNLGTENWHLGWLKDLENCTYDKACELFKRRIESGLFDVQIQEIKD